MSEIYQKESFSWLATDVVFLTDFGKLRVPPLFSRGSREAEPL